MCELVYHVVFHNLMYPWMVCLTLVHVPTILK